jgi:hypothetical protein
MLELNAANYKVFLINEAPHNENIGLQERRDLVPP